MNTNTEINFCDTCEFDISTCGSYDIKFGDGKGNDNVISCGIYKSVWDKCNECFTPKSKEELNMFGGVCEECNLDMNQ